MRLLLSAVLPLVILLPACSGSSDSSEADVSAAIVAPASFIGQTIHLDLAESSSDTVPQGQFPTSGTTQKSYVDDNRMVAFAQTDTMVDFAASYSLESTANTATETATVIYSEGGVITNARYETRYTFETATSGTWEELFNDEIRFSGTFTLEDLDTVAPTELNGLNIELNLLHSQSASVPEELFPSEGEFAKTFLPAGEMFSRSQSDSISSFSGSYTEASIGNALTETTTISTAADESLQGASYITHYYFETASQGIWTETFNGVIEFAGAFQVLNSGTVTDANGDREDTLEIGGVERHYLTHLAPDFSVDDSNALVVVMHGQNTNAFETRSYTNFNRIGDQHKPVVVYPTSLAGPVAFTPDPNFRHWDAYYGSGFNDVAFIDTLLDQLVEQYNIDRNRIYLAGFSNGGMMSHRLVCELPGHFAAFAAVAAIMPIEAQRICDLSTPIPLLTIHGTADTSVPYEGFEGFGLGEADSLDFFAEAYNCNTPPTETALENVVEDDGSRVSFIRFSGCDQAVDLHHYRVDGGGHTWPGSPFILDTAIFGETNADFNATDTVWQFFNDESRQ